MSKDHDLLKIELQLLRALKTDRDSSQQTNINKHSIDCVNGEIFIDIELFFEQKFYLAFYNIPKLLIEMSDPRKNLTIQSLSFTADLFDLIFPTLLRLFESPKTCVNSFLYLFRKLSFFLSRGELVKKFLPILLNMLNIVDLDETIEIDLASSSNEEKYQFCKLFQYTFINEVRIIFGLKIFLEQICPLLIEAISGLKDFELDVETPEQIDYDQQTLKARVSESSEKFESSGKLQKENSHDQPIFMMDNINHELKMTNESIDEHGNFEEASSLPNQEESIKLTKKLAFSLNQVKNIQNLDFTKQNSVKILDRYQN